MTMYLEHFGLREAPFRITPHTEFFFAGANRWATLEALLYAITAGEGMVKVTGEVGSGKTMLCRVLMERLPDTVETIYLAVPSLTRDEMLAAIAGSARQPAGPNATWMAPFSIPCAPENSCQAAAESARSEIRVERAGSAGPMARRLESAVTYHDFDIPSQ